MRKVLSLLLCVAMLCSLVVITAQAESNAPAADVADVAALPGSTVTVDIFIRNNPGFTALKLYVTDEDNLGATFSGATSITQEQWAFTPNNAKGVYVWYGPTDYTGEKIGTLSITIPNDATLNESYTFSVVLGTGDDQAVNAAAETLDIANTEFKITVAKKAITGVNVALNAGIAIGVHAVLDDDVDPDDVSIVALNADAKEYTIVSEYKEGEADGEYIYYINVNPWTVDAKFLVDFADAFAYEGEKLDLAAIPSTAKTVGVLSYCDAVIGSASAALKTVLADMIEYCRQVQIYKDGAASLEMPEGLSADTVDGSALADYCYENYYEAAALSQGNSTPSAKASFSTIEYTFGAGLAATFSFELGTGSYDNIRIKAAGQSGVALDEDNTFTYMFSPLEFDKGEDGVQFELFVNGDNYSAKQNKAWTLKYSPVNFVSHLVEQDKATPQILAVLSAYNNFGIALAAYN